MGLMDSLSSGIAEAADAVKGISLRQIQADIEEQKQLRLLEVSHNYALDTEQKKLDMQKTMSDTMRTEAVARQDKEFQGLRDAKLKEKQGLIDSKQADEEFNDAMLSDKESGKTFTEPPKATLTTDEEGQLRTQAGIKTGDINAMEAAKLNQSDLKREMAAALQQGKFENLLALANIKGEFGMAMSLIRGQKDGNDRVMAHGFVNTIENQIRANFDLYNVKEREMIEAKKSGDDDGAATAKLQADAILQENKQLRAQSDEIYKQWGFTKPAMPEAPKPVSPTAKLDSLFPKK